MPSTRLRTIGLAALTLLSTAIASAADPAAEEHFEKNVRPVLVESCVKCHGDKKQSGGLRLDSRDAAMEGGENGPAIVPGQPDQSPIVRAVRHEGDVHMPPKGKLPDPAVQAMADWIKMGAPWPSGPIASASPDAPAAADHWAFRPVQRVEPPRVSGDVATPVDAFLLAKLEEKGLGLSPQADKRTLLRRATFDLTGLPPTIEEVAAFEADAAPDAFAKAVDRLLASPRYGERWGRYWLDIARYADTKGYVFQEERRYPYAYTYRDYVIRAFNEDLPYDQFLIQQLAADRLPLGDDPRPLAALGFLTLGRRFLNDENDIIDDRIDVVTRGLMGLTVACARCHDHKFDPIPTEDYYSLHGIFGSSEEPKELPEIAESGPNPQRDDFLKQRDGRKAEVAAYLDTKHAEIRDDLRKNLAAYLQAAADAGPSAAREKFDEVARARKVHPKRLAKLAKSWTSQPADDPIFRPWHALAALPAGELAAKAAGVLAEKGGNRLVIEALAAKPPTSMVDVAAAYGEAIARARAMPEGSPADPDAAAIRERLDSESGPIAVARDEVPKLFNREEREKLAELNRKVDELVATHPGAPPKAMVLKDRPAPREPHIFLRGNPGRPGKPVPRRFLKVASGPDRPEFKDGSGRLELARAITRGDNPLTARVMVNRIWMYHFGAGLVTTPSDFGLRSDPPSHPELLDFLASRFVEGGWSVKAMHRLMLLSHAYQQRSDDRPDARAIDPQDRLLWRQARRRLDFEAMRDSLLAASGKLDETPGGRPVVLTEAPFPARRTVYGFIDRQNLDGVYRTFDFASPDATSARRFSTIVPQQALFLMNGPFVAEQAQALAALAMAKAPESVEARLRILHERSFGRAPSAHEVELGTQFLKAMSDAPPPSPETEWMQGFGAFDESTGKVNGFTPFAHFKDNSWQFGAAVPDPVAGFLNQRADGGHPGPDASKSLVRRWVAPRDAVVAVEGTLAHDPEGGDGVRARVVAPSGPLGTWTTHHGKAETPVERIEVKRGESIDFVVDCLASDAFDSFTWAPTVRAIDGPAETWRSKTGFKGPPPAPLTPLETYAQVLLLTNEFIYVD